MDGKNNCRPWNNPAVHSFSGVITGKRRYRFYSVSPLYFSQKHFIEDGFRVLSCLYIAGTIQSKFINQTNDCNYAEERENRHICRKEHRHSPKRISKHINPCVLNKQLLLMYTFKWFWYFFCNSPLRLK